MNVEFLKRIPLFEDLDEVNLEELSARLVRESVPANHTIFWMGDRGEKLYIVLSGKVQISYIDEQAREVELSVLHPGSFFGELSLIDGLEHTATARSIDEVTFLTLGQTDFYEFLGKHPALSKKILFVLASRLRSSTARLRGVVNVNEELAAKSSSFQRSIDGLARAFTSGTFITICVVFLVSWILLQVLNFKLRHNGVVSFMDKPPTFFILGFLITLTSFILTILILNSQRRQAEHDRIRGEIEYQVNLKAQTEVVKLQSKVDRILKSVEKAKEEPKEDDIDLI